ncbi:MAG: hypothetical protein ABR874_23155 [Candidatus Sulfotelmatobacter sp.]|jgi:YD repeat-containing protein
MSQTVAPLPPPPIDQQQGSGSFLRYGVFVLLILVALAIVLELRLVNSTAGKEALERIRGDERVRTEFGGDIHAPFAVGWAVSNQAWIYAFLSGKDGHGHVRVDLEDVNGKWTLSELVVYNDREGHLIDLSRPEPAAKREDLQQPGSVFFVPLGDSATADVAALAGFFEQEFGIAIKTLPAMTPPLEAYDNDRKQWVAEMLTQAMTARYPEVAGDPDARIIGISEDDAYIRSFGWAYTFSYRDRERYSVVPVARLNPSFYGFAPSDGIRMERLRKVVMKQVGLTHLGFKEIPDAQSVDALESSIADIDRMGSVFLASDVRTRLAPADADGSPCLTLYSANVAGMPLRKPILPCWQHIDENETSQYQVDLARGRFQLTRIDLYRGGPVPLVLQRMNFAYHYDDKVRAFGKNSWHNIDDTVWSADPNSIQTISINGTLYERITPGAGFSALAKYRAGQNAGIFSGALLSWDTNGGWRIDTRDGEVWKYLGCGPKTRVQCYYMGHTDYAGDGVQVKRETTDGHIERVFQKTNPNLPSAAAYDHTLTPLYEGDKISEIDDSDGRKAQYRYDRDEYLSDVDADGHHVHYDYDDAHRIVGANEDGHQLLIHYDAEGRPDRLELPNGSSYVIHYSGQAIEVTGPDGSYTVSIWPTYFGVAEHKN